MENSIRFHTLTKLVDTENFTSETNRILEIPLDNNKVLTKLESQHLSSEKYDSNPEVMFAQRNDPKDKTNPRFRKTAFIVVNQTTFFSNCF